MSTSYSTLIDRGNWGELSPELSGRLSRYLKGIFDNDNKEDEVTLYIDSLCSVIGREDNINQTTYVTVEILIDMFLNANDIDIHRVLRALSCVSFNRPYTSTEHMKVYDKFKGQLDYFLKLLDSDDEKICLTSGIILSRFVLNSDVVARKLADCIFHKTNISIKVSLICNLRWLLSNAKFIGVEPSNSTMEYLQSKMQALITSDNIYIRFASLTVYLFTSKGKLTDDTFGSFDQCIAESSDFSEEFSWLLSELDVTLRQLPEPQRLDLFLRAIENSEGEEKTRYIRSLISLYSLSDLTIKDDSRKRIAEQIAQDREFWKYERTSDHPTHLRVYATIRAFLSQIYK